jgi:hypothetical protein
MRQWSIYMITESIVLELANTWDMASQEPVVAKEAKTDVDKMEDAKAEGYRLGMQHCREDLIDLVALLGQPSFRGRRV